VLNALSRKIRAFRTEMRAHFSREAAFARKIVIAFSALAPKNCAFFGATPHSVVIK
jgi:hypothetical protein